MRKSWLLVLAATTLSCKADDAPEDTDIGTGAESDASDTGETGVDSTGDSSSTTTSTSDTTSDTGDTTSDTGDTGDTTMDTGDTDTGGEQIPPIIPTELTLWLQAGNYLGWESQSTPQASKGPHFGNVLVYMNTDLAASLQEGLGNNHPIGAAAVKEFYGTTTDTVIGWAVTVRTEPGQGGAAWYWYQSYQGSILTSGQGEASCSGCHADGVDSILTPYPL